MLFLAILTLYFAALRMAGLQLQGKERQSFPQNAKPPKRLLAMSQQ